MVTPITCGPARLCAKFSLGPTCNPHLISKNAYALRNQIAPLLQTRALHLTRPNRTSSRATPSSSNISSRNASHSSTSSSSSPTSGFSQSSSFKASTTPSHLGLGLRRSISFNMFARQPTPSPLALVHMTRLEADANAHPTDIPKQVALWTELIQYPAGQKRVLALYERLMEFDKYSPLIRSNELFGLYLRAILATQLGGAGAVDSAVRARDAILNLPPPEKEPEPEPMPLSESQVVARDVINAVAAKPKGDLLSNLRRSLGGASLGGAAGATDGGASGSGASGARTNPVHVIVEEPKGSLIFKAVRFILVTGVVVFVSLTVLSMVLESTGISRAATAPRNMEFEPAANQKIYKFSDVHGVDEAKDDLQEIVQFLKDPSSFNTLGGRLPKGVLLTGPPGTGKTLLARAVAGEAGVPFLFASGSEFDEMYVGVGAKRIRELFAAARKKQPAIIFIDELDAVGGRRSSRDQQYVKQTLNQLLVELDGFNPTDGVIVIAATNFPEMLDKALVRPGRFDKEVAVPLPDVRGRVQILLHHMRNVVTSPEVEVDVLARGTPGFSGAELENMVNQAAVYAARKGSTSIALRDLEWAKDKILMGTERNSAYIPEKIKRSTAVHESGHALVALFTEASMPLHKVTCIPRGHALGLTQRLPKDDRHSVSWKEYVADIDVCLGGRVAEEIVYGKDEVSSGCSSDLRQASQVANNMVQHWGYSDKVGLAYFDTKDNSMSTSKREEIEFEVDKMLRESQERVRELLRSRRKELDLLTEALVEHETLDLKEVETVIKGEKIRTNEPSTTKPSGGLAGIVEGTGSGGLNVPPPDVLPPGVSAGPLPHPQPQSSGATAAPAS